MEKLVNYLNEKGKWTNLVWGIGLIIVLMSLMMTVMGYRNLALIIIIAGFSLPVLAENLLEKYSGSKE